MALRFGSSSFRPLLRVSFRPQPIRYYASKETLGEGVVGKGDKNARPVITDNMASAESKEADVKKHNEDFEKRPDRAANVDGKKDQDVNKDFWKGQGGVDREP